MRASLSKTVVEGSVGWTELRLEVDSWVGRRWRLSSSPLPSELRKFVKSLVRATSC